MKKIIYLPLQIILFALGYLYAINDVAWAQQRDLTWRGKHAGKPFVAVTLAQVTSDGTVNTIVNQNDNVAEITGGETRGSNLFHSFQDFSVTAGNEAFFNNANDISSIFSRVTGGNISNIDGLIRANGNANLFLINPAGIMFGTGARLDLGGSFYGTTGDRILFDGGEFSAVDNLEQPLLTVNAPIGLGFRDNPAEINANNISLEVSSGTNISLIGGNINLEGGLLKAPGGKIELGGLNQAGIIEITEEGNLSFPSNIAQADISLSESAVVDVTSNNNGDAGEISIMGQTFELSNNAQLIARNPGEGNQADGGNVTLDIADSVVIKNGASINVEVESDGIGNAGEVNIKARTFELLGQPSTNRTIILAPNDGAGNSGTISIETTESIAISNSTITAPITEEAAGNSGNIILKSPEVSITDNAIVSVSSQGNAEGGSITIDGDNITVDNFSLIAASSRIEGSEGSGNITLNGKQVTLSNGGVINATTASNDNAGEITINAEILELFSGGVLQTATEGDGNAGNITLNISDRIILNGNDAPMQPEIFKISENENGEQVIFAEDILNNLAGQTGIFAGATETIPSTGGNIEINTDFIVAFPGGNSDILANSQEGEGGTITINAESLLGIAEGNADFGINSNDIDASSGIEGLDGTVTINTPDINPIQGATELPSNVVSSEQAITQACQNNKLAGTGNSFTIKARGGVSADPTSPLDSETISINGEITPVSQTPQPIETAQGTIQPARGIKKTKSGAIILTAYRTNNSGDRLANNRENCT